MAKKDSTQEPETQEQDELLQYDLELQDFLSSKAAETDEYLCYLYRQTDIKSGKASKKKASFLRRFENEIPDFNEIASLYGSGNYMFQVCYTDKKSHKRAWKSKSFTIDPDYIKGFEPSHNAAPPAVQMVMQEQAASNNLYMANITELFKTFMASIAEIMKANQERAPGFNLEKLSEGLSNMVIQNAQSQMQMVNMFAGKQLGIEPEEEEEAGQSITDIVFSIINYFWEHYGQQLLTATKAQKDFFKNQVKGRPEYKTILDNPDAYKLAYDRLVQSADKSQVDSVLQSLEIPTPDMMQAPAKTEAGETAAN